MAVMSIMTGGAVNFLRCDTASAHKQSSPARGRNLLLFLFRVQFSEPPLAVRARSRESAAGQSFKTVTAQLRQLPHLRALALSEAPVFISMIGSTHRHGR